MIKAICFDVHDTLIDKGRPAGMAAAKKLAVEFLRKKYPHVNDDLLEQARKSCFVKATDLHKIGREFSFYEWYGEQLRYMGIGQFDEDLINELNQAFMLGYRQYTTVLPGARESLQQLSDAGYKLAVVSNSLGTNTRIDLEITGLTGFFDHIVTSSEVGWRKPHPKIFQRVLELLEAEPAEVVFVGDNPKEDIRGAVDAGMHTVAVRCGREKNISSAGGANGLGQSDFKGPVLDTLFDLVEVINQLQKSTDIGRIT